MFCYNLVRIPPPEWAMDAVASAFIDAYGKNKTTFSGMGLNM